MLTWRAYIPWILCGQGLLHHQDHHRDKGPTLDYQAARVAVKYLDHEILTGWPERLVHSESNFTQWMSRPYLFLWDLFKEILHAENPPNMHTYTQFVLLGLFVQCLTQVSHMMFPQSFYRPMASVDFDQGSKPQYPYWLQTHGGLAPNALNSRRLGEELFFCCRLLTNKPPSFELDILWRFYLSRVYITGHYHGNFHVGWVDCTGWKKDGGDGFACSMQRHHINEPTFGRDCSTHLLRVVWTPPSLVWTTHRFDHK